MMGGCDREVTLKENRISITLSKLPSTRSSNGLGGGARLGFGRGYSLASGMVTIQDNIERQFQPLSFLFRSAPQRVR
jgi:hypothetical protein